LASRSPSSASSGKAAVATAKAAKDIVCINRAPVLTLWMAVCLERLGAPRAAALGGGKLIASWCAVAKGRSLGLIPAAPPAKETPLKRPAASSAAIDPASFMRIAGQTVRCISTPAGVRAADPKTGGAVDGDSVERYLRGAFKGDFDAVRRAMASAAAAHSEGVLRRDAMLFYERFRPAWKGWGVKGELRLSDIRAVGR